MMSILLYLFFMIPLSFIGFGFWFNQLLYFILFLFVIKDFSFTYLYTGLSYFMGLDLLSFVMVILSVWICSLMVMASESLYSNSYFSGLFIFVLLLLMISLFLTFSSMNLFVFYLFFEMSLIPTLMLIIGWGYQPERLQAGVYLLFYTLFASLPMMVAIFYCYSYFSSLDYFFLLRVDSLLVFLCINFVFFVKVPMYFVHLWLPKAHVEAPVSGSMILAGVMLKLGGYGLMRLMCMFTGLFSSLSFIFISVSMVGGFLVSFLCLRQVDIKALIAYSSVAHMGIVLGGIMTLSYWGMCGALVMMVAHGLCSSGLFCLANISYERLGSRSLFLNKGLINLMPIFSLWWFLFSISNMAAPPSLNLLGEIMLINSLVMWSGWTMMFLSLMSFFGAGYSLYLYSYSQHGKMFSGLYSFSSGAIREYLLLFLHWVPLNLLILSAEYFTLWI